MADTKRITLDEVVPHFAELEDPRSTVNLQHPLVSVVVIAMLAVLAGAGGPTAIARWAALKEQFLLDALDLPNGIPRKDVFRRVLMALRRRLPGVLRDLADVVACGRGRNDWRGATHPGGGWQNAAAEPRSQERPGRVAFGQHLGQRVRALAGAGGVRREIERNHGDSRASEAGGHQGSDHHHRRHGDSEGDCRGDHRRQGRLRTGA